MVALVSLAFRFRVHRAGVFVHIFLGTSNLWLLRLFVLARSVVLNPNFSFTPNFNFREIVSLRQISFLGEKVSVLGVAVPRTEWQWLATGSLIVMMTYFIDAVARQWLAARKDSRRKARTITGGLILPMFCVMIYTQWLVFKFGKFHNRYALVYRHSGHHGVRIGTDAVEQAHPAKAASRERGWRRWARGLWTTGGSVVARTIPTADRCVGKSGCGGDY
jgi:hypothetical protein